MIERFNGRIAEVLNTTHFASSQSMTETLLQYVTLYNQFIPQKALGHISPALALKKWHHTHPHVVQKLSL